MHLFLKQPNKGVVLLLISLAAEGLFCQSTSIRFERITIEDGLSQTVVNCIQQDRSGYLWFGTQDGLNRYDGYHFKVFWKGEQTGPERLHSDGIQTLLLDHDGKLWIGTDSGLNWFDEDKQIFRDAVFPGPNPRPTKDAYISGMIQDHRGFFWINTMNKGLMVIDPKAGLLEVYDENHEAFAKVVPNRIYEVHQHSEEEILVGHLGGIAIFNPKDQSWRALKPAPSSVSLPEDGRIFAMATDHQGVLWFGGDYGLFRWDPTNQTLDHPKDKQGKLLGPGDAVVWALLEDREGALWVSGVEGLYRIKKDRSQQSSFLYDSSDPHSMGRETQVLYQDDSGVLWAGSFFDGLLKLPLGNRHFIQYRHSPGNPRSMGGNAVRSMMVDRDNQLWVGTYERGLNLYRKATDDFIRYQSDGKNNVGLPTNDVLDIAQTGDGKIWAATIGGVGIFDQATQSWESLTEDPTSAVHIRGKIVYSILEDHKGRIWLGNTQGLQVLDSEKREIATYANITGDPTSLVQDDVMEIWQDSKQRIWFGTFAGLSRFLPEQNAFQNYLHDPANPHSLSQNYILSFCEDSKGQVWIGTTHGLSRYREASDDFENFGTKEKFPNNTIYGILEDENQWLWLSTNAGLVHFDPQTKAFHNFDVKDGLQSNEFSQGGFAKDHNGRMYFGGINGISAFFPQDIKLDTAAPQLLVTDFLVRNRSVIPHDEEGPLRRAIHLSDTITLTHRDYLFAFEFAAINFNNPQKNKFAYMLEGLDEDWIYMDATNRRATYTKLEPGDYTFRVKGSNGAGVWNEQGSEIKLRILPPFYRTTLAYLLYALMAAGLIFGIYAWRVREYKTELGRERVVNEKLQQLNQLKDDFLANTSHELRTPLNGIIGLAESLQDGSAGNLPQKADHNLGLIIQSGRRLSHLVSDLLDFSSIKTKTIQVNPKPVDLFTLAEVTATLLKSLAEQKGLQIHNRISKDLPGVLADEARLQQILLNLVGNAIKLTETGSVTLHAEKKGQWMRVMVSDTGPGVPEAEQDLIFQSFERGEAAKKSAIQGTGVGLALTSRLVKLHGGDIQVANNAEQGATFSFTLPVAKDHVQTTQSLSSDELVNPLQETQETWFPTKVGVQTQKAGQSSFRILIVDDDPVNRQVLLDHLTMQDYRVSTASDGEEALILIENQEPPDLILLDIMMPQMSGYEVCRRLRERYSLNELPVIFLTAKNQIRDLVTSFEAGANDYLTKPINKLALISRVQMHIKLLDANRNLERKVKERTQQLSEKNETLEDLNSVLEKLSLTDPMTHLGNRRYLRKHLDQEVALVKRNISKKTPSDAEGTLEDNDLLFLLFDLDHFKRVNDTYGHLAGDEVLIQIKGLMEAVSREYDFLVRWGGEEFLIVFRKANRHHAASLAERLRKKVAEHPFALSLGPTIRMTASIGVAVFPFKTESPENWTWEQVLDIADQALYLAKENGRNAWVVLEATDQTPAEHVIEDIRANMENMVLSGKLSLKSSIPMEEIVHWSKAGAVEQRRI